MKLYYSKGACSLAIRIAIHELGLSCEFESVDLKNKKTEAGHDYFAINAKGSVPALQVNSDTLITEGAVILQYLADLHHQPSLLPKVGELSRYRVLEWLNFTATDLHKGCTPFFNPHMPEEVKETIFKSNLKRSLSFVAKHLDKKHFIEGKTLSIADCYLFVILSWMPHINIDLSEWPALTGYFAQLKERKAFQQALKEEGLTESHHEHHDGAVCSIK